MSNKNLHTYAKSQSLFDEAKQYIPGGVNSPVRAFNSVGGTPVFIKKAKGAIITDEEGQEYIDYINSWGPMILGHAFDPVVDAIKRKIEDSASFGAPTALETEMAKQIAAMVPGVEKVRMVNSGTEACMSAIRLARGYTQRDKVIKFAGNYHGHADSFLIQAGSGALTMGVPNSPGVPQNSANNTLIAQYNDLDSVQQLIEANPGQISALIVEPVAGNMGCIPPQAGFLAGLRELCTGDGIVLIFDEVMTGFRLAAGGAQERFGVTADLVTLGKIIGGGMPVGAFAGKAVIMNHLAPDGPVYQAGTLSGNPIAMISGLTTLRHLADNPQLYQQLEAKGTLLKNELAEILRDIPHQINQLGSMISVHFCEDPVMDYASAKAGNNDRFRAFFHQMLARGIYLPPSAFESWFFSIALTDQHIATTLAAAKASVAHL
ncbi:MAG: glutamate-1-semialdehyde 2,1-aminomutase [Bacteroidota bacterium]